MNSPSLAWFFALALCLQSLGTKSQDALSSSSFPSTTLSTDESSSPTTVNKGQTCRTVLLSKVYYCPVEKFRNFACLSCYTYMDHSVLPEKTRFHLKAFGNECKYAMHRNKTYLPEEDYDYNNDSSAIYGTIPTSRGKNLWMDCCKAAWSCCDKMINDPPRQTADDEYCPRTWDGWQCFEDTTVNDTVETSCPNYIYFQSGSIPKCRELKRSCLKPNKWPGYGEKDEGEWTNYQTCSNIEFLNRRHRAHIGAYCVSVVALAPALIIFFSYKQLRVQRITMHKNLFAALFINGIVFIAFKKLAFLKEGPQSFDGCNFLYVLTRYTRATTYMWMFCESFYLHKLIVAAFAEQKNLIMYYIIGWGFPIIPVLIYTTLKFTGGSSSDVCWFLSNSDNYLWAVNVPNLLSLAMNFFSLFNIIRVLVTKLKSTHANEPSQYRKAVRATLVLVPLFGIHFFITIYVPGVDDCIFDEVYYYTNYLMDGLQGFLVSLLFCYLNGEVLNLIKRSYSRRRYGDDRAFRRGTVTTNTSISDPSAYEMKRTGGSM